MKSQRLDTITILTAFIEICERYIIAEEIILRIESIASERR